MSISLSSVASIPTLRGHFPAEMKAIESALPGKPDGWIIAPLFLEGGRYTINDVQYVSDGDRLTPVGDTEFARDPAFAFQSSNLREWVEEKTAGQVDAESVLSVSIDDLRRGGPGRASAILSTMPNGGVCIVNGASNKDMEVFVQGLLDVETKGRKFLFRAAASFIKALLGQSERPLLTPTEMGIDGGCGALIVVGSHVPRTTQQLNHLLANTDAVGVEANVASMLSDSTRQSEIDRAARITEDAIKSGSKRRTVHEPPTCRRTQCGPQPRHRASGVSGDFRVGRHHSGSTALLHHQRRRDILRTRYEGAQR